MGWSPLGGEGKAGTYWGKLARCRRRVHAGSGAGGSLQAGGKSWGCNAQEVKAIGAGRLLGITSHAGIHGAAGRLSGQVGEAHRGVGAAWDGGRRIARSMQARFCQGDLTDGAAVAGSDCATGTIDLMHVHFCQGDLTDGAAVAGSDCITGTIDLMHVHFCQGDLTDGAAVAGSDCITGAIDLMQARFCQGDLTDGAAVAGSDCITGTIDLMQEPLALEGAV